MNKQDVIKETLSIRECKPRYKHLKFGSDKKAFYKWLRDHTKYILEFKDFGQDLLKVWIDERGEILDSDAQQSAWIGGFVDITKIKVGKPITMYSKHFTDWRVMSFVIDKIKYYESDGRIAIY